MPMVSHMNLQKRNKKKTIPTPMHLVGLHRGNPVAARAREKRREEKVREEGKQKNLLSHQRSCPRIRFVNPPNLLALSLPKIQLSPIISKKALLTCSCAFVRTRTVAASTSSSSSTSRGIGLPKASASVLQTVPGAGNFPVEKYVLMCLNVHSEMADIEQ